MSSYWKQWSKEELDDMHGIVSDYDDEIKYIEEDEEHYKKPQECNCFRGCNKCLLG